MALWDVLVYDRVAYETNEVGDAAAGLHGDVGHLAVVLVELDRFDEPLVDTYVVDLVVDRDGI